MTEEKVQHLSASVTGIMNWFRTKVFIRKKSIDQLVSGEELHRHFTLRHIFLFCIAATIGAGIFVLTGTAAAGNPGAGVPGAGPGIAYSFIVAGFVCALVGLAYAEMAGMIPISGSAYSYTYATLGELVAFIIAWDLILEYALGASAVAVGWSSYLQHVFEWIGLSLPASISVAPPHGSVPWFSILIFAASVIVFYTTDMFRYARAETWKTEFAAKDGRGKLLFIASLIFVVFGAYQGVIAFDEIESVNLPAAVIILAISYGLTRGVKETAKYASIMVAVKLAVILLVLLVGGFHLLENGSGANWTPFLPNGWSGVITGASIVFFAYIGFDAIPTMAEECQNPQKDLPVGMLGGLAACTVLYVLMSLVMTGAVHYSELGTAAPIATVLDALDQGWALILASIGALAGITSVLIVLLYGQSRITMKIAQDGLVSSYLAGIHPVFKTPHRAIAIIGFLVALPAALLPIGELAELVSIGTLAAFVLVSAGVIYLRYAEPNRERHFRCPGAPLIPTLAILGCLYLMLHLPAITWMRFIGWMAIALIVYFAYGRSHSKLHTPG